MTDRSHSPDATQPIPAATVVVVRERPSGAPELLMLERSTAMAFAGGALVFPGGRVDPGDHAFAATLAAAPEDAVSRLACIRETIEEAGVALAFRTPPDAPAVAAMRVALHGGATLAALVRPEQLDLGALEPFARWVPRGVTHRIFDTMFYLARWEEGAPDPSVDATENSRLAWMTAADVLAQAAAGRVSIIFPTRRNLERLARFGSFDAAVADARANPVVPITPWIEARDGTDHLCIPDGLGYPVTSEPLGSAQRA